MLLAVLISSYGCTWEVWRALKKLEFLSSVVSLISSNSYASQLRALQTSHVHPQLDIRKLSMNQLLNVSNKRH